MKLKFWKREKPPEGELDEPEQVNRCYRPVDQLELSSLKMSSPLLYDACKEMYDLINQYHPEMKMLNVYYHMQMALAEANKNR